MNLTSIKDKVLGVIVYVELAIYLVIIINATAWSWKWWGWKWAVVVHLLVDILYCCFKLYMNPGLFHYYTDLGRQLRKKWDEGEKE